MTSTTDNEKTTNTADWAKALVNEIRQGNKQLAKAVSVLSTQAAALCGAEARRDSVPADPTLPHIVRDMGSLDQLGQTISKANSVAVDLETNSLDHRTGEIVGVGFAMAAGVFYVPTAHRFEESGRLLPDQLLLQELADVVDFARVPLIAHNAKFELQWLRRHLRVTPNFIWDPMIAAKLLRADRPAGLKDLAVRELDVPEWELTTREMRSIQIMSVDRVARYCAKDCYYTLEMYERQRKHLG